ncbi:protein YobA [Deinococcus carri]|uniref:Protein YobA n=1 Tax=Deinococcus carri TaxID=1211323 RepID=A0ABP9W4C5_9DEIO
MRILLSLLTALTLGTALAHTEVTSVTPGANARVSAPTRVVLTFGEPLNLRFATLKVLPLPPGMEAAQAAAQALASRDDGERRVDTAPILSGQAARVVLPLRTPLRPGRYLIAWRILSEDGHPVSGHSVFQVR